MFGVIQTEAVVAKAEGREMELLRKESVEEITDQGVSKEPVSSSDPSVIAAWSSMKKGKGSSYQLCSKWPSKRGW